MTDSITNRCTEIVSLHALNVSTEPANGNDEFGLVVTVHCGKKFRFLFDPTQWNKIVRESILHQHTFERELIRRHV